MVFHGHSTMVDHVLLNGRPWLTMVKDELSNNMVDHGSRTMVYHGRP